VVCARKHRGLSGRIAAADDHNLVTETELGFHGRGAVVDTGAFEHRQVLERRFPVLRSSRDDDRTCEDFRPSIDFHGVSLPVARQPRRAFRDHHLGTKLQCLRVGAACQV